uniref:BPTI/Kunitz inhibitor domain-containing protein n=1 Tax=Anser brachyrhynchus TaxID=132585 RepID=A0A8B9BWH8_9AVES
AAPLCGTLHPRHGRARPSLCALSLAGSPSSAHLGPRDHADFCYLPSVCGNCKALFIRFFYNASSQRCEEFIYGGCGGNRNNFETKRECFQACSHAGNQPHRPGASSALPSFPARLSHFGMQMNPSLVDICHLPPEHGPCRGHFYRYAYNPATGTCRVFLYGGCRGNANNFETLKECQRACQRDENLLKVPIYYSAPSLLAPAQPQPVLRLLLGAGLEARGQPPVSWCQPPVSRCQPPVSRCQHPVSRCQHPVSWCQPRAAGAAQGPQPTRLELRFRGTGRARGRERRRERAGLQGQVIAAL